MSEEQRPADDGSFCDYIRSRIKKNKNFLACITGQTGSGKSYSALRIAQLLDKDFNISRVCFNPKGFMGVLNAQGLRKGNVLVFDEAGVGMSSRNWQSLSNKLLNYCLQTFRHMNLIVLFTAPDFAFVDSATRRLFHCCMETCSIDVSAKTCAVKPLLLQVNQRSGNTYYKYLRVLRGHNFVPLARWHIHLPSKDLVDAYELKKKAFTQELNQDILEQLSAEKSKAGKNDGRKELTAKQERVLLLLKQGLLIPEVAKQINIPVRSVYEHLELIKKKGVRIIPIKEGIKIKSYTIEGYSLEK